MPFPWRRGDQLVVGRQRSVIAPRTKTSALFRLDETAALSTVQVPQLGLSGIRARRSVPVATSRHSLTQSSEERPSRCKRLGRRQTHDKTICALFGLGELPQSAKRGGDRTQVTRRCGDQRDQLYCRARDRMSEAEMEVLLACADVAGNEG